jgi:transcription initiation factor TFIIIB Brf1 subunit/transcription initiation factor TFIIB/uncharacterized C2H2 Zn-finger protein
MLPAGVVCAGCGNADAALFDTTMDTAELVCTRCGAVAVDHMLFEGQAEREFTDSGDGQEESRAHASFPHRYGHLMSAAFNLQTVIRGGNGSEDGGGNRGKEREEHPHLNIHMTSTWRRDVDTQRCIAVMEQAADKLGAPADAVNDAIEQFAHARRSTERMLGKEVQMAAYLYTAMASHARKTILPVPKGEPTVPCPTCAVMFHSTTERAQHCATSSLCKAAAVKKDAKLSKRMRASLDCNFNIYAPL